MVRMRVFGILAGYEDRNDHDTLRTDPVFKLVADRSPRDPDLARQPTLSRFENQINIRSPLRLGALFVDQFIASFAQPPRTLTFDLDAVDDPTHGSQQLSLFHGFYEQYQYLPLVLTSADTDRVVMLSLRHGTATAWLGADDDLEYLVNRLRAAWPTVRILVRGDAGFGKPVMLDACERLGVEYTFGLSANAVLQRLSEQLLAEAMRGFEETHEPQRRFTGFAYQAGSWPAARRVIVKAEANAQGTNRRFVVTNRPGASLCLEATYDEYAMRGESENRNKELKCGLAIDRLSDHRFVANLFRMYLHGAASNLLVRLRREIADPPPLPPGEPLAGAERKRYQKARRRPRPAGGRPSGHLAHAADQGSGVGGGDVPPHRGGAERQLAEPELLRAGPSARVPASRRGALLDGIAHITRCESLWGKGGGVPRTGYTGSQRLVPSAYSRRPAGMNNPGQGRSTPGKPVQAS